MAARMWPFWWFVPPSVISFEVRVFNMRIHNMAWIANALVEIIQDSTVIKSGYTDSQGKYSTSLGIGTYTIRISKSGYQTITKTLTLATPGQVDVNLPDSYPPPYVSGIGAISTLGAVPNPTLSESVAVDKDKVAAPTNTISESVVVTVS